MVRALSQPGRYGDGETLFLNVAPRGSKSWIQRLTVNGKGRDLGLGGWPLVTLAEAREQAFENRRLARRGGDPVADKPQAKAPTSARPPSARSRRTARGGARRRLRTGPSNRSGVFPVLADLPVDQIGRKDVLRVLSPIWGKKLDISRKLRGRIRAILAWAQVHGFIEHKAAGEAIDGALPSMPTVAAHFRVLPYREVAALDIIEGSKASVASRSALRFLVLTAAPAARFGALGGPRSTRKPASGASRPSG